MCSKNHTTKKQHLNTTTLEHCSKQYLHFLSLKTATWTHKEIFGSKFVSFELLASKHWISITCNISTQNKQWRASQKQSFSFKKDYFCTAKRLQLQHKTNTVATQNDYSCNAKGLHLKTKKAKMKNWMATDKQKSNKNAHVILYNRFLICNTFLLSKQYLHVKSNALQIISVKYLEA